jgi:hypothetical protein
MITNIICENSADFEKLIENMEKDGVIVRWETFRESRGNPGFFIVVVQK